MSEAEPFDLRAGITSAVLHFMEEIGCCADCMTLARFEMAPPPPPPPLRSWPTPDEWARDDLLGCFADAMSKTLRHVHAAYPHNAFDDPANEATVGEMTDGARRARQRRLVRLGAALTSLHAHRAASTPQR